MPIAAFYENIRTGACFEHRPMPEAVADLMDCGLEGIYICLDSMRDYAAEVEETVQTTGVPIAGLHAWIDVENTEDWKELVDTAAAAGTDHALIVPTCKENDPVQALKTLTDGMRKAVYYGKSRGVRVCMEDLDQKASLYNSLSGLKQFLTAIPDLSCCFDTGNLIMHQEDELAAAKELRNRICAMHLKDRTLKPENPDDVGKEILDGTLRYPVPVGSGYIRIREILECVGDVPLIVELYDYSPAHMLEGLRRSVKWVSGQIS